MSGPDEFRAFVQMIADLDDGPDTSNCETLSAAIEQAGRLVKPTEKITLTLRIDNTYQDPKYDKVTTPTVVVPVPPTDQDGDEYDTWKYDHIFPATGTGHTKGDAWHDVTVTASSAPHLIPVGTTWDFGY